MADIASTRQAYAYHHASQLPEQVWHELSKNQAAANVILPFAMKAQSFSPETHPEQLWIVLSDDTNNVEFVLSCTEGPMGKYPIFIVVSNSVAKRIEQERVDEMLADAVAALILCLLHEVPPQRVFSVFSIAKVSHTFAKLFVIAAHARQAHAVRVDEIYYDATFTFCTPEKFKESLTPTPPGDENLTITLRLADQSHVEGVKVLCQAFSSTPYVLDDRHAQLEAETMINNKQVWVHLVQKGSAEAEVACLVATTRESDEVTAVTKVFTAERWRSRGCAERLLHRVCQDILLTKKRVVLYVGNELKLKPARKLYHKIGFQGFQDDGSAAPQPVEGVERWAEIGFKGTELGYW